MDDSKLLKELVFNAVYSVGENFSFRHLFAHVCDANLKLAEQVQGPYLTHVNVRYHFNRLVKAGFVKQSSAKVENRGQTFMKMTKKGWKQYRNYRVGALNKKVKLYNTTDMQGLVKLRQNAPAPVKVDIRLDESSYADKSRSRLGLYVGNKKVGHLHRQEYKRVGLWRSKALVNKYGIEIYSQYQVNRVSAVRRFKTFERCVEALNSGQLNVDMSNVHAW